MKYATSGPGGMTFTRFGESSPTTIRLASSLQSLAPITQLMPSSSSCRPRLPSAAVMSMKTTAVRRRQNCRRNTEASTRTQAQMATRMKKKRIGAFTQKPRARSISWSPTPPPPVLPAKKSAPPQTRPALGGRASGLTAADTKSAVTTKPKPKKPMTAVDRMQELRESESQRLSRKRELQHKEEMARIDTKKVKYQLKLLQAQNERSRINKRAMTSPSPRRRTRVLNLPPDSPSRARTHRISEKPLPFPNTHLTLSAGIGHSPASHIPSLSSPSHQSFTSTSFASGSTSFASDDASGHFPDLETSKLGMDWLHSTAAVATPMQAPDNYVSGSHAGAQAWPALPSHSFTDGQ